MVILRAKGVSLRNPLVQFVAYDTVRQRKILPIQEIKAAEMEIRKRRMVSIPKRDREEEGGIINPYSSAGIYVTASVEAECRLIARNRKMKEEEKIKMIKLNALKRAARMNQRGNLFVKLCEETTKLPNDMMAYEYPSTTLIQLLLSLSINIVKDSYQHLGGNIGQLPD